MMFAGYQGEASVHTRALRSFAELCKERSQGAVAPAVLADVTQEGVKAVDLLDRAESGRVDVCYFASSYLAGRVPALRALDLPFSMPDRRAAYAALDGRLGELLRAEVESRTGFRVLAFWDNGIRHLSNGIRPIRHPADCTGLRLRCLDSELHRQVFAALGFEPVTIDVKDMVQAVMTGTVDAQENPHTNTLNFGLHRSHRHVSETAHFSGIALVLANRAGLAARPASVQEAIVAAGMEATIIQRRLAIDEDAASRGELIDAGCQILPASELDLGAFSNAVQALRDDERRGLDPRIRAELPI